MRTIILAPEQRKRRDQVLHLMRSVTILTSASLAVATASVSCAQTAGYPTPEMPTKPALELVLACPPEATVGLPLECDFYVAVDDDSPPIVVPKTFFPFRPRLSAGSLLEIEVASNEGAWRTLDLAPSVGRGRYEGTRGLTPDQLIVLGRGAIYGRRYDLNGGDWLLPSPTPKHLRLRAKLTFDLVEPSGRPVPAVRELVKDREWLFDRVVPRGSWTSPEQVVVLVTASRP